MSGLESVEKLVDESPILLDVPKNEKNVEHSLMWVSVWLDDNKAKAAVF